MIRDLANRGHPITALWPGRTTGGYDGNPIFVTSENPLPIVQHTLAAAPLEP